MRSSEGITQLLIDWGKGDQAALEKLMPLVYSELRRLASNYLRRERAEHTLQPTALVNEAYLKLIDQRNAKWQNRAHFFGISAQLMRRSRRSSATGRWRARGCEGSWGEGSRSIYARHILEGSFTGFTRLFRINM
jgi:hypothetical protein